MTMPQTNCTIPSVANYEDLLADLKPQLAALQTLRQQAIATLTPTVQNLVRSGSRDVQRIEHSLDQLLELACLPEGLALFKTLCRHYWPQRPLATASYVQAYREMWDEAGDTDTIKAQP